MIDFKALLNSEQYAAVTAGDGPLLVLAAAGTGKTRTLVHRVAYLYDRGVDPSRMLLLTFTNRAAREMLDRASQTNELPTQKLWSGTFHHVCNRMLRRFAPLLGYEPGFTIIDRDDATSLINECIRDQVGKKTDFPKKDVVLNLISSAVNNGLPFETWLPKSYRFTQYEQYATDLISIAKQYCERKLFSNAMDFDDLLINGVRLLKEHEHVRLFYQEQFEHVLIDEYQDTNRLQAEFTDILAERSQNITAVGDDFQCIYSWRGANFENIIDFPKRWPNTRIIKLERNYRSTPEILTVANCCIRGNTNQFQKTLIAARESRSKPHVLYLRNGYHQAQTIVRLIDTALTRGYQWSDIAILYRSHFHSIETQIQLAKAGIPHAITSGTGIFEKAHSKDFFSLLRLTVGIKNDYFSFIRLLMLLSGIGEKTAQKIWHKIGNQFDAHSVEQCNQVAQMLKPTARDGWGVFSSLFKRFEKQFDPLELVQTFLDDFYVAYLQRNYEPEDAHTRQEDLLELARIMRKSGEPIDEFLAKVALLTNLDRDSSANNDAPAVLLSTIHQAKGREWPVVIIPWLVEEMFPSAKTLETNDDQEERRLFYVAVTRAKDELFLCSSMERLVNGANRLFCKPSRFLKELDKGIVINEYPSASRW